MRLIGVLFYEITNKKRLQHRLHILTETAGKSPLSEDDFFGGEVADLSARQIDMLRQSIELFDLSMALRCQISEMRIVLALRRTVPFSDLAPCPPTTLKVDALSPRLDPDLLVKPEPLFQADQPPESPSHREQQVMQLLVEGNSNKEVASILNLSIRTVETYRARLMVKLHLHSVADLVRYAVRNNLIKA